MEDRNKIANEIANELHKQFMKKFGINIIQYYAFVSTGGREGDTFPDIDELKGQIVGSSFAEEFLSTCWFGGEFYEWITTPKKIKIGNSKNILSRPDSAIGPYEYKNVTELKDNTIVHGSSESDESHLFFITVVDNKVTIFNTYGGQCNMYIKEYSLTKANNILRKLETNKKNRDYAKLSADFFGYKQYREKDTVHEFTLEEHPFWLPSSELLSEYLSILQHKLPEKEDKKIIAKARKFLLDNPYN